MSAGMEVDDTVLVTSDQVSDDPLAMHGAARGWRSSEAIWIMFSNGFEMPGGATLRNGSFVFPATVL